jgi:hypothetical protein
MVHNLLSQTQSLNEVAINLRRVLSGSEFEVGDFVTTITVRFRVYKALAAGAISSQ